MSKEPKIQSCSKRQLSIPGQELCIVRQFELLILDSLNHFSDMASVKVFIFCGTPHHSGQKHLKTVLIPTGTKSTSPSQLLLILYLFIFYLHVISLWLWSGFQERPMYKLKYRLTVYNLNMQTKHFTHTIKNCFTLWKVFKCKISNTCY